MLTKDIVSVEQQAQRHWFVSEATKLGVCCSMGDTSFEPQHNKNQNGMCAQQTQISIGICPY